MPEWFSDQLAQVSGELFRAAFVCIAYLTARSATERLGTAGVVLRGLVWCGAIGLLAAVVVGQGSCVDGDPMFGYCGQVGGYAPTLASRAAAFLHVFLLLFVPVIVGALNDRARMKHSLRSPAKD